MSKREHFLTCLNNNRLNKSQLCNEQRLKPRNTRLLCSKIGGQQNVRLLLLVKNNNFYI